LVKEVDLKSTLNFIKNNLTLILVIALALFLIYGVRQCSTYKYKRIIRENQKIFERTVENQRVESDQRIKDLEEEIEIIVNTETKSAKMAELEEEIENIKTKTGEELEKRDATKKELLKQNNLKDIIIKGQKRYIVFLRENHVKEKLKLNMNFDKIKKEYVSQIDILKGVIVTLKNAKGIKESPFGGIIGFGGGIKKGPNGLDVGYFLAGVAWGLKI
jgi:vacuolar-type H+-ATPase subunit E/Vma4